LSAAAQVADRRHGSVDVEGRQQLVWLVKLSRNTLVVVVQFVTLGRIDKTLLGSQ
jgi:hypothetical protein